MVWSFQNKNNENHPFFEKKKYPVLARTKINELFLISQDDIALLMNEMRKLQKDSLHDNLTPFRFDAGNHTEVVYVPIPMA